MKLTWQAFHIRPWETATAERTADVASTIATLKFGAAAAEAKKAATAGSAAAAAAAAVGIEADVVVQQQQLQLRQPQRTFNPIGNNFG